MTICLYSPYVPQHAGGGEKYFFDVVRVLASRHQVTVAISGEQPLTAEQQQTIRRKYERFLNISLTNVSFVSTPLGTAISFWQKLWWTHQFDVLYYVTDGSLFFSLAKRNIVHIQIPFTDQKNLWLDRLKFWNWQVKNTNSDFTRSVIEKNWRIKVDVTHHPLIDDVVPSDQVAKQPLILHVGRFFRQLHSKRQDVIVSIFRQLRQTDPKATQGWQLVLIGGNEDQGYVDEVKAEAKGLPVTFIHNANRKELLKQYQQASIYWHATGYGVDANTHPEKMEHFGISTVEAMAAGCAPMVIDAGGQPEIMGHELQACLWQTPEECVDKTLQLIKVPKHLHRIQQLAIKRAKIYGYDTFAHKLWLMIGDKP